MPSTQGQAQRRILSIDAARTVAIFGMIVLHALPANVIASLPPIEFLTAASRPQLLFAVLDGISLGVLAGIGRTRQSRWEARRKVTVRAVVLIALGLFLASLGSGIIIILDYYGFFFLLALPFLYLRTGALLRWMILLAATGPLAIWGWFTLSAGFLLPPPLQLLMAWLLVGEYPAAVWMGYVLLGLLLYRLGIEQMRLRAVGAALFVFALGWCIAELIPGLWDPIQETAQNVSSGAFAVLILGLLVIMLKGPQRREQPPFPLRLAFSMGSMPLSSYCLHVIATATMVSVVSVSGFQSWTSFWISLLVCGIFSVVWTCRSSRGPIELWVRWMTSPVRPSNS